MEDYECAICKEPIEPSLRVTLGEKGSATINQASKDRKESLKCSVGQVVHVECRRKYCSQNSIVRALNIQLVSRFLDQRKNSSILEVIAFIVVNQQC